MASIWAAWTTLWQRHFGSSYLSSISTLPAARTLGEAAAGLSGCVAHLVALALVGHRVGDADLGVTLGEGRAVGVHVAGHAFGDAAHGQAGLGHAVLAVA